MLFKKITLENYGLYAGTNEFVLSSNSIKSKDKPIILFGGKNGAGKTTFLEALKLVLYGKRFLNSRMTNSEYETFLRNKIHNGTNSTLQMTDARVAIEFDYVTLGQLSNYYVERSWHLKLANNTLEENLQISINGTPIENVTEEYWRGFVEEIIPERLAQLFFFDGEKIQEIAGDNTGNKALANSIKSLLGLDVVEKLKADLSIYKNKELIGQSTKNDKIIWDIIEKDISSLKSSIELHLSEKLPAIRTSIEGKHAEIRQRESQLHSEGNLFATRRDSLKKDRNRLSTLVEKLENEIRKECELSFPFSLCPTISNLLLKQIKLEKEIEKYSVIKNEMTAFRDNIIEGIKNIQQLNGDTLQHVTNLVSDLAEAKIELPIEFTNFNKFLELSDSASRHIHVTLTLEVNKSKVNVKQLSQELVVATKQLREITIEIGKIPEDEQIKPIFEELSILNQELGVLKREEALCLKTINKLKDDLKNKQKDLNKLIEKQTSQNRLELVDKVQSVLDEYLQKLTISKTSKLQLSVTEAFNSLSRKSNLIDRIEIDPITFAVTLIRHDGEVIPKSLLSSGEKQLYAVAMLWGLARTSGRPLPVIVDTPLGRLDSDHRINLITNYFPEASHQVILLSTDTEVDKELFSELKPYVSRCYHLDYDSTLKRTVVKPEYFWREDNNSCLN